MRVVAIENNIEYWGVKYPTGTEFEVDDEHGKLLITIGKVRHCAMSADEPEEKTRKKGRYHRSDLRAEE